jgi:hypothetical protein
VNVLKPQLKHTVVTLLENGVSQHEISRKTGIDRKTIRKIAQALAGANSPMATGQARLADRIPPPRPPAPMPSHARSACEPHREWIEAQVRLGRNATAIYQELVDRFGFGARYNSVKRFCRGLRRVEPEQFDRLEFLPGEEAQVDFGAGPTLTGATFKTWVFVMTLAWSRHQYAEIVRDQTVATWLACHRRAFGALPPAGQSPVAARHRHPGAALPRARAGGLPPAAARSRPALDGTRSSAARGIGPEPPQGYDQAAVLGHGNEVLGRDQALLRMLPAHQYHDLVAATETDNPCATRTSKADKPKRINPFCTDHAIDVPFRCAAESGRRRTCARPQPANAWAAALVQAPAKSRPEAATPVNKGEI